MRFVENGYSGSMVAVIAVVCTCLSLLIGFVIGFGISWYRYNNGESLGAKPDHHVSSNKSIPKDNGIVGNWYEPEPVRKSFQSFSRDNVENPIAKQQNTNTNTPLPYYVNDLKKNNSLNVANSAVETTLQAPPRRHRTVHL